MSQGPGVCRMFEMSKERSREKGFKVQQVETVDAGRGTRQKSCRGLDIHVFSQACVGRAVGSVAVRIVNSFPGWGHGPRYWQEDGGLRNSVVCNV